MPNGRSDCCGTCWYNSNNDNEARYQPEASPAALCTLRNFDIPDPFWTYCANHRP